MVCRSRLHRLCFLVLLSVTFIGTYVTYFRHPPADVLLRMNRSFQQADREPLEDDSDGDNDNTRHENVFWRENPKSVDTAAGSDYWNRLIKRNNLVVIGAVYNKCEGQRSQLGAVVLEVDKERGGVMTRTMFNVSLEEELVGGEFHLQVKYNGRDLFDNYWELCDLEQQLPVENRTFTCPVAPGKWSKQKIKHVPSYLPSGRYQTKAWATDDANRMIACGFSDFLI